MDCDENCEDVTLTNASLHLCKCLIKFPTITSSHLDSLVRCIRSFQSPTDAAIHHQQIFSPQTHGKNTIIYRDTFIITQVMLAFFSLSLSLSLGISMALETYNSSQVYLCQYYLLFIKTRYHSTCNLILTFELFFQPTVKCILQTTTINARDYSCFSNTRGFLSAKATQMIISARNARLIFEQSDKLVMKYSSSVRRDFLNLFRLVHRLEKQENSLSDSSGIRHSRVRENMAQAHLIK